MKVKILTTVAWGKRIVVVDFGDVAVATDELGYVVRFVGDKAEIAKKWEEGSSNARLFVPREEVVDGAKKKIVNGELVVENLCNARAGRIFEIEFPEYRIFERALS